MTDEELITELVIYDLADLRHILEHGSLIDLKEWLVVILRLQYEGRDSSSLNIVHSARIRGAGK